MHTTIDLEITPDKPTKKGNIWSQNSCQTVVDQINKRAPIKAHFMEKANLHPIGKPAFEILGAEIDDSIKIHIGTLQTQEGKLLEDLITSGSIECLPIIETGSEQPIIVKGKPTITKVKRFVSIGINANPIIRAKLGAN